MGQCKLDYKALEKNPRLAMVYYPDKYTPNSWRMWVQLQNPSRCLVAYGSSCEEVESKMQEKLNAEFESKPEVTT